MRNRAKKRATERLSMRLTTTRRILLVLLLTAACVVAGYFPYPYYTRMVMERLHLYSPWSEFTAFRIFASLYSLRGIAVGLLTLGLAWLCKREGFRRLWMIGRICSAYCIILLGTIVALMWLQLSIEMYGPLAGGEVRMGYIFRLAWI